jgi:hypothetical protein
VLLLSGIGTEADARPTYVLPSLAEVVDLVRVRKDAV